MRKPVFRPRNIGLQLELDHPAHRLYGLQDAYIVIFKPKPGGLFCQPKTGSRGNLLRSPSGDLIFTVLSKKSCQRSAFRYQLKAKLQTEQQNQ